MTRGRELIAYAIADEVAAPIPVSITRLSDKQRLRTGHFGVASCRHCRDGLFVVNRGDAWRHRETGSHNCREALANTGTVLPQGAHQLERHPRSGMWYCPTCAAGPYVFTFSGCGGDGAAIAGRLELADRADLPAWTERMYRNGCRYLSVYEVDNPEERVAGIGGPTDETGLRTWWALGSLHQA